MKCVNCLSRDAYIRSPHGFGWLWSPLFVEIHCNRCISDFYYPTIAWAFRQLMELTEDGSIDDDEDEEPLRKSATRHEPVDLKDLKPPWDPKAAAPEPKRDDDEPAS